jgi:hypothetical protein
METTNKIEWTRVNNDINGNPRYVCHFLNFITDNDDYDKTGIYIGIDNKYKLALQRAKKIGGKKYHNKRYDGGILIQSYNIQEDERHIIELMKVYK